MLRRVALALVLLLAAAAFAVVTAGRGWYGSLESGGAPRAARRPPPSVAAVERARADAADRIGATRPKQILFGDLHAHTTFSTDAFTFSLPMAGGEGAHPPADACDFARHCAALDFWSINDHAEELTPRQWQETLDSIRQCNAVGDDTVAFLGWEWTQAGTTPDDHFGHRNVVLRYTDDARIPARPIGAAQPPGSARVGQLGTIPRGVAALLVGGRFHDWASFLTEREAAPRCDPDVPVRELPSDCIELTPTPAGLLRRLDEWGHESLVIPHGTTWGAYTPAGSRWDKQLRGAMHDPDRQRLLEVYSGHGDSEVYRSWRAVEVGTDGTLTCPEPSEGYLPSCWRAGEIIQARCLALGESAAECQRRAAVARAHYVEGGIPGHLTVPGVRAEEWLDAGQCADCMQPAFNYRPAGSAQYVLALGDFSDDAERPRRFRFGFMASSDNHFARPGTGYKERNRIGSTESIGASRDPDDLGPLAALIAPPDREPAPHSLPFAEASRGVVGFQRLESERSIAFLLTGGLIGAHAEGRDRDAIWEAFARREVYGTTGPRMLLWFDLLNPPGSRGRTAPMGSEVALRGEPVFQARAVGSFEQQAGCPDESVRALGTDELRRLCQGECYHPADTRRLVTRIEVVRIRPQIAPDEDVASLIDDPWRRFDCDPDPAGCAVTFSDPEFAGSAREAVYYVRAFEAPKPGINAGNLRCERDADGRCTGVKLCPGPDGAADACLAEHEPRAWSSPIYLDPAGS
ncbi:MAG: DUF3604 domain-containing protein [Myxococcota bacterium]|nr:DUF3604 domain-containing protein [Myxococcota bacterium]